MSNKYDEEQAYIDQLSRMSVEELNIPLEEDLELTRILNERQAQHGEFFDNANTSQGLKTVVRINPVWETLHPEYREGIDNILQKVARFITSGGIWEDSLVDIQGYAELMRKRLKRRKSE